VQYRKIFWRVIPVRIVGRRAIIPAFSREKGVERMIDKLLLGNYRFRETDFTPNIDYYRELASSQHPTTLWIGCSDSRLQTGHITQARAGELFIQRNIGNIVPIHDWNFATVLEYAVVHLKVEDVVICGHSNCGAIRALERRVPTRISRCG
jgi:carbonic anhydrase